MSDKATDKKRQRFNMKRYSYKWPTKICVLLRFRGVMKVDLVIRFQFVVEYFRRN